jgi:membrane protease subunit HflK
MSNTSKVMIDSKANGNVLFLPLDKLVQQAAGAKAGASQPDAQSQAGLRADAPALESSPRNRDLMRSRERGGR